MSHNRNKFKDENYKVFLNFLISQGEDYNAPIELENGPLDNRSCTDVLCCLLFVAFLAAMLGCGIYGYFTG